MTDYPSHLESAIAGVSEGLRDEILDWYTTRYTSLSKALAEQEEELNWQIERRVKSFDDSQELAFPREELLAECDSDRQRLAEYFERKFDALEQETLFICQGGELPQSKI